MKREHPSSDTGATLPERYSENGLVRHGTLVRVMSPVGLYWPGTFRDEKALYSTSHDLVFTATHFDEVRHQGDYYSEFDDPMVEEVLLIAALSLPIGRDGGMVSLYPHTWSMRIPSTLDLHAERTERELRDLIRSSSLSSSYRQMTDPVPPPLHGGPGYNFRDAEMPLELQRQIFGAADAGDHLLVRGLGAWVKARMLLHHQMFALEALYSLFVALDASFSLVCRELRKQGVKNPDAWDAGAFLDAAEGRETDGYPYFADFYVDRVRTVHPESRYGVSPYAPVSNCDAHTLFENLRDVFRLLILGKVVDPMNYPHVNVLDSTQGGPILP